MQPGRAAEGQQREVPRIDAAAHRDQADAIGHAHIDQAMHALRRRHGIEPECRAQPLEGR